MNEETFREWAIRIMGEMTYMQKETLKVKKDAELRTSGWVIKDLADGSIDIVTNYPQSKSYAQSCELNEGYKWVEVSCAYTELEGSNLYE